MKKLIIIIMFAIFFYNIAYLQENDKKSEIKEKKFYKIIKIYLNEFLTNKDIELIKKIENKIKRYNSVKNRPLLRKRSLKVLIRLLKGFDNNAKDIERFFFNKEVLSYELNSKFCKLLLIKKRDNIYYYFIKERDFSVKGFLNNINRILDSVEIELPFKLSKQVAYNLRLPNFFVYNLLLSNDYRRRIVFPYYKKLEYDTEYNIYLFYNIYNFLYRNIYLKVGELFFSKNFLNNLKVDDFIKYDALRLSFNFSYPIVSKKDKELCFLKNEFKEDFFVFQRIKSDMIMIFSTGISNKSEFLKEIKSAYSKIYMVSLIYDLIKYRSKYSVIEFNFLFSQAGFSLDISLGKLIIDFEVLRKNAEELLKYIVSYTKSCKHESLEKFFSKYEELNEDIFSILYEKLKTIDFDFKFQ